MSDKQIEYTIIFDYPEKEKVELIYKNNNANAESQFVIQHVPYELIKEANKSTNSDDDFINYIDEEAYTELVDIGTEDYEIMMRELGTAETGRFAYTKQKLRNELIQKINRG